jgi:hypothetical protein
LSREAQLSRQVDTKRDGGWQPDEAVCGHLAEGPKLSE